MTVLVIGDIVTDILAVQSGPIAVDSDTASQISTSGGGSAANTAAWLAHAGATAQLLAVVGADAAGAALVEELRVGAVGVGCVVTSPSAATGTVIVLAHGQVRTMLCDRGANLHLRASHVDAAFAALPDIEHVHLSGYTLLEEGSRPAGLHALAAARHRGIPSSVDAASAAPLRRVGGAAFLQWVHGIDLLLANLDEALVLTGPAAGTCTVEKAAQLAASIAASAGSAVVKLGPNGAVWAQGGEVVRVPAEPAKVVDTTGAGDAFAAGLIAGRLRGLGISEALVQAVRFGAQAVATVGGRPRSR